MAIEDGISYELTGAQVKDLASKINAKANSSSLATVATSGSYTDLINTPVQPTVYDGTLTIQHNGTTKGTFTANQSAASMVNIETIYADDYISTSPIPTTVTTAMIEDEAVTTAKIDDGAVTNAKIDWSTVTPRVIQAGEISIGTVSANSGKRAWISIPTQSDTNYAVVLTYSKDVSGFATTQLINDVREVSRFEWFVWNFGGSTTGSLEARYIVVKY